MILVDILTDGIFAAVAAIGFGAISDPPLRAFPSIALLAAIGHALRFCLMTYLGVDIATASLFASFSIGMGSLVLGKRIYCPMTVLYIPAYDSGYVRLQNSILTHHVHAEYESTGIARKVSDRLIHEHNRYL
mgnify:CR=1 FL=1